MTYLVAEQNIKDSEDHEILLDGRPVLFMPILIKALMTVTPTENDAMSAEEKMMRYHLYLRITKNPKKCPLQDAELTLLNAIADKKFTPLELGCWNTQIKKEE